MAFPRRMAGGGDEKELEEHGSDPHRYCTPKQKPQLIMFMVFLDFSACFCTLKILKQDLVLGG